jgi:hypothetical protein
MALDLHIPLEDSREQVMTWPVNKGQDIPRLAFGSDSKIIQQVEYWCPSSFAKFLSAILTPE